MWFTKFNWKKKTNKTKDFLHSPKKRPSGNRCNWIESDECQLKKQKGMRIQHRIIKSYKNLYQTQNNLKWHYLDKDMYNVVWIISVTRHPAFCCVFFFSSFFCLFFSVAFKFIDFVLWFQLNFVKYICSRVSTISHW